MSIGGADISDVLKMPDEEIYSHFNKSHPGDRTAAFLLNALWIREQRKINQKMARHSRQMRTCTIWIAIMTGIILASTILQIIL